MSSDTGSTACGFFLLTVFSVGMFVVHPFVGVTGLVLTAIGANAVYQEPSRTR
jgi:hypothetical protein